MGPDPNRVVTLAWKDLPADQRALLESIGASRCEVTSGSIGQLVDDLLISAGKRKLPPARRRELDEALGTWIPQLRLVVINASHSAFAGLDDASYEESLARVAWHEWGHALSLDRADEEDMRRGGELLSMAPKGISEVVREGNYRATEITHELIAEVYALLMARRRRGVGGKPPWLETDLWRIVQRTTGWTD